MPLVQNFVDCMYFGRDLEDYFGGDLGSNSDFVGNRCIDYDKRGFDTAAEDYMAMY